MVDHCLQKRNDEQTNKCEDCTENYLVLKKAKVLKPELIYISSIFTLGANIDPIVDPLDILIVFVTTLLGYISTASNLTTNQR